MSRFPSAVEFLRTVIFCFSAALAPITAIAQGTPSPPPAPYPLPSGTPVVMNFGSYLESVFQTQLGVCLTGAPLPKKLTVSNGRQQKDVSAIPPALLTPQMHLEKAVMRAPDSSIGRVFAYVYPSKTVNVPNPDISNYLIADYLEAPQLLATVGFPSTIYDYGCAASIAASIQSNAGWNFPAAQVGAAIQADVSSKSTYQIAVVDTLFNSPVVGAYDAKVNDTQWRTYGRMLIWDWYDRNPLLINDGQSRYLLKQFSGISLYQLFTSSFSNDGSATLNAGVSLGVLSAKGNIQASYNQNSTARVENFQVLIREAAGGGEDDLFVDLPKPSALASLLSASAHAYLDPTSTDHRFLQTTQHIQVLSGVTKSICTGNWAPTLVGTLPGTLALAGQPVWVDATTGATPAPPSCKFTVSYTLPTSPASDSHQDLVYTLNTSLTSSDGSAVPGAALTIKTDVVSLSSSGKPAIQPQTSTGVPSSPSLSQTGAITFFTYTWPLTFPVDEDPLTSEKITGVQFNVNDVVLNCVGRGSITPASATATYVAPTLTLQLVHRNNDSVEKVDYTKTSSTCSLSGKVTASLASGASVTMELPATNVFYAPPVTSGIIPPPAPAPGQ